MWVRSAYHFPYLILDYAFDHTRCFWGHVTCLARYEHHLMRISALSTPLEEKSAA